MDQKFDSLLFSEHEMMGRRSELTFIDLPLEIRFQIWSLSLPRGRVLKIAFKRHNGIEQHAHTLGPVTIPTILHICHESREFAKTILGLGFGINSNDEDRDWWNPSVDILYLPPWQPPANWDLRVSFNFQDFQENFPYPPLDIHRDDSNVGSSAHQTCLATVRHLALPFNFKVLNGIKFSERSESWLPAWLHSFPTLTDVKFLIDHVPQWYRAGDILLYEPLDVPLNGPPLPTASLTFNTPSRIEAKIMQKLEEFKREFEPDWKIPSVKIMVVGNTERKEVSPFCLPVRSGL